MSERPRRALAGANMAKLLLQAEEDEFYKVAYGGFNEDVSDKEYTTEGDLTDIVDSDFDLTEESDHPISDQSVDEDNKRKRKMWEVTKPKLKPTEKKDGQTPKKLKPQKPSVVLSISRRSTTAVKSEISKIKREHEQKNRIKRKVVKKEWKMPSQEEVLEEAKKTEEKNLELLDAFRRHEELKKKHKATKRAHMGAYIRYHSIAAPIVKFGSITNSPQQAGHDHKVTALRYCTRNFVTFSDPRIIPPFLLKNKPNTPTEMLYCPVTRLPAKYIDPLTLTPYATAKAFRVIRDSFAAYEELRNEELYGSSSTKRTRKRVTDDAG